MFEAFELSERYRQVLTIVVEDYIRHAEPVGSRTVSKRLRPPLSPATVRNIMADLEELGFLTQPHVSAGRIPTEEGFRYYVENLLEAEPLPENIRERIELAFASEEIEDLSELLRLASKLLTQMTGFPSVVSAPKIGTERLLKIDFVFLGRGLVLVVAVTEGGIVVNRLLKVPRSVTQKSLERLAEYLNYKLPRLTLEEARDELLKEIEAERKFLEKLFAELEEEEKEKTEPIVEGLSKLLDIPEFKDVNRLKELLAAFEEKNIFLKVIERCLGSHGVQVLIGSETGLGSPRNLSAVASPYGKNHPMGGLAVIGPIRMDYSKVVPVVDYTSKIVSHLLDKFIPRT
ncbi:heat-inducible transcriptional repressor HrcA [Thermodesulfatator atlanticus]|uniref:heat-inducible transcriptional repressor HrcA n=1 Tax=Thermodesulfatator atlanticus TaxID=501497 RepID=UPI0003B54904|nr:heat-inducible transcriptional repressor HrcA [Thermodesulfatator atlanticus]